tara:strand:+ start:6033 stop:11288 length:5256 start_codon:yes stop_codon:yes gene_type:complete
MSEVLNKWGNFFKENPEKILGEVKEVKGRFGMVTITEGDPSKIKNIDVPQYKVVLAENPTQTTEVLNTTVNNITDEQVLKVKKTLRKSKKRLPEIKIDKANPETILWDFDDIDEMYNVGISDNDKRAYVFYIEQLTGKSIEGGFKKYSGFSALELMELGVLFYDIKAPRNRMYQPKFLYQSGNIYRKRQSLISDKESYLSMVSQSIYEKHLEALNSAYEEVNARKLTLDNPIESLRLKILPTSNIAKNFKIDKILTPSKETKKSFSVYVSNKKGGQEFDMTKRATRGNNSELIDDYNLKDAFILWLKEGGDPVRSRNYGIIYRNGMDFNQIYSIYIKGKNLGKGAKTDDEKNTWLRTQANAKKNGDRLFAQFLAEGLVTSDRIRLEFEWNLTFNATLNYDVNKVPIGFQFAKYFGVDLNDIRPEKREAVGFSLVRGSSCLAYGVGIGKTWCGIFTLAQNLEMGLAKRPLVVVPNQVYPQFLKEIRNILPQYDINGLYNMRGYYEELAYQVKDLSISICTYEGLEGLGFSSNLDIEFTNRISSMLESTDDKISERQKAKQQEKYETMLGKGKQGSSVEIDDENVNFDYIVCDEAHNFKKLFTSVKGETKNLDDKAKANDLASEKVLNVSREKTPYSINSGVSSTRAVKLFFLTQYIQMKSPNGNCLLLTATPFTNSPLEVYSILAMINYNYLSELGFKEMRNFFDTFADISTELVINTLLKPVRKQVFKGWNNVIGLQDLVFNFIDKKGREDEDKLVTRPNKIILPLNNKMIDGIVIPISEKNRISTTLKLSDLQSELMETLQSYAQGEIDFAPEDGEDGEFLCDASKLNTTSFGKLFQKESKAEEAEGEGNVKIDSSADDESKFESAGVRALQCLAYSRQLALSPYLYSCSGLKEEPTPEMFVESSPKLMYVVECIRSVKNYHDKTSSPMSGQVIYMDIGTKAFPLISKYIVDEIGLSSNEVGFITGGDCKIGNKKFSKSQVQDAFLGRFFNEEIKDFETISDDKRLKVLIGSSSIREGMNLQNYGTVLYNCYLDFNPTDNIQLEGRIWRQGNNFKNVRIVMPMMENSMDIFMFQKLEEKTERINQLWVRDGMTNEINTASFDPSELKYELITDPVTLAELRVEDDSNKLDDAIDDINYQFSALNNFAVIYKKADSYLEGDYSLDYPFEDWKIVQLYYFIKAFRPDLITKNLFVDSFYEDNTSTYNSLTYNRFERDVKSTRLVKLEDLNYSPEQLIEFMVVFNKDKKIAYPDGYTKDWRDIKGLNEEEVTYEIGDVVTWTTKRGEKQGKIIEKFSYDDFDIELDNGLILENVDYEKLENFKKLVEEVEKELATEVLEPFNWGTKKAGEEILDISLYQQEFQTKSETVLTAQNNDVLPKTILNYLSYTRNSYKYFLLDDDEFEGSTYTFTPNYQSIIKWTAFIDVLNSLAERHSDYGYGYKTGKTFYSSEDARVFAKIKKGEEDFLKPRGIKNQQELNEKIEMFKSEIKAIEEQKKALSGKEEIEKMAEEIAKDIILKKTQGIRKPSTFMSRAAEFASSNADYKGNEYLSMLVPTKKKKDKKVEVVEEVAEPINTFVVRTREQLKADEDRLVTYNMNKTDKKIWSQDFEIIDNRDGLNLGEDAEKWAVSNRVTGYILGATSKADAKDIIANAPAYGDDIWGIGTKVEPEYIIQYKIPKKKKSKYSELTPIIKELKEQLSKNKEVEEVEAELTANDINELIEGLELGLEYLDGEDLEDAKEQIEGLKITLDYI